MKPNVEILDLNFQDTPGVIAAYLLPHTSGAVLVESGPGSTVDALTSQLNAHGFDLQDVTDVFLTHIHLDHAGAAGWLSQHGARIHVHPRGAPHLIDPSRLIASAARIYKDQMTQLWGEILPVEADRVSILDDKKPVDIHGITLVPLDTPGHANHHMAYLVDDICFSGDIGGVRLSGSNVVRAPMPPPEFHLERWLDSISRLLSCSFKTIAPTHYGFYNNPNEHLQLLADQLKLAENWMVDILSKTQSEDTVQSAFTRWIEQLAQDDNLSGPLLHAYELANPSFMSLTGIQRYWQKYRNN